MITVKTSDFETKVKNITAKINESAFTFSLNSLGEVRGEKEARIHLCKELLNHSEELFKLVQKQQLIEIKMKK